MKLTKKSAINLGNILDSVNREIAPELIRYSGGSSFVNRNYDLILIRPKACLIKPWIEQNIDRIRSFGIEGQIIEHKH